MRALLASAFLALTQMAVAGAWEVSEADDFGYRRALIDIEGDRLAIVCPPDRAPFAVPVVHPRPDGDTRSRVVLGLEVDGIRHDQPMACSEIICEAELSDASWRALLTGRAVTVWFDEGRGPTFPLLGSAEALGTCRAIN